MLRLRKLITRNCEFFAMKNCQKNIKIRKLYNPPLFTQHDDHQIKNFVETCTVKYFSTFEVLYLQAISF